MTRAPVISPKNKAIVLLPNVLYGVYALFTGDTVANIVTPRKELAVRYGTGKFWECYRVCTDIGLLSMQLAAASLSQVEHIEARRRCSSHPKRPRQTWLEAI
ncbi:hypothetical protein BM221_007787 [Beauveria bassiana]|uniref:Uncharacterized protein n=1 Tax=Beauveria bassiana TaxID=176275 RepID=A0A2N6NHP7_BEABA|nr:hypothetical protein BM221_007787 [Beauveria bassiana]